MERSKGQVFRLFLVDGTPDGLTIVDRLGWTGQALQCARAQFAEKRGGPELIRTGVYVLIGQNSDGTREQIYIGEADVVGNRLDDHVKDPAKDFWTKYLVFTSNDGSINKAHAKYIESSLYSIADRAKVAEIANGNEPAIVQLSEQDRAFAESFLEEMLVIFPLLQVSAFRSTATIARSASSITSIERMLLFISKPPRSIEARANYGPEGFVVLADSTAEAKAVDSVPEHVKSLRTQLLNEGVLVPASNGKLRFAQDWIFSAPSTAAGVVLGASVNGRDEWKNEQGMSLNQIESGFVSLIPDDPFVTLIPDEPEELKEDSGN